MPPFIKSCLGSLLIMVIAEGVVGLGKAYGEGFHLRAREHYEAINLTDEASVGGLTYEGFTNTLHWGYEKPFHYLIGIAASPLFAILSNTRGSPSASFGQKIRLVHLGLEAKGFPLPLTLGLFLRLGVYRATLQTNGSKEVLTGTSGLLGLGYEWNVAGVGVAPEVAWRTGSLQESVSFRGSAPAIGVHFYKLI